MIRALASTLATAAHGLSLRREPAHQRNLRLVRLRPSLSDASETRGWAEVICITFTPLLSSYLSLPLCIFRSLLCGVPLFDAAGSERGNSLLSFALFCAGCPCFTLLVRNVATACYREDMLDGVSDSDINCAALRRRGRSL